jgi:hypothetical protein
VNIFIGIRRLVALVLSLVFISLDAAILSLLHAPDLSWTVVFAALGGAITGYYGSTWIQQSKGPANPAA